MEKLSQEKRFSIVARARSFKYALQGIGVLLKTQPNFWIHIVIVVIVTFLGFFLRLNEGEWATLVLTMTMVIAAEAFNTAFEFDMDLTSPDFHPYARDTKDVAAGAVLLTVVGAVIVGLIIFVPKIAGVLP